MLHKVIIFDLGGVIINLEVEKTLKELSKLMHKDIADIHESHFDDGIFVEFETGRISPEAFRQRIREISHESFTDNAFDNIWNMMLQDIPAERIAWLKALKQNYQLALLSNTNKIHIDAFNTIFKNQTPYEHPSKLFDHIFYSYELNDRKPNTSIYEKVLHELQLPAAQTIFYDDKQENLDAAHSLGINTVLVPRNQLTKALLPQ